MKKQLLLCAALAFGISVRSQAIITSWKINTNGTYASYWENTTVGMGAPNYVFNTTTDSADVLKVCYDTDSVWISCDGMTDNMGKYLNPGDCLPQNYVYRFPRNPTVPSTKTISSKTGAIGCLINGIPIYGLSNSYSWNGSTNTNMGGAGVWNVEVYDSEGFVLDTAFGAHPQQSGAYHSHATPWRLYENYASNVHSPIVGWAFDGYPVYGPYGYSSAMNSSSGVTRMKTGYALRNITTRTTLPSGATASQTGPPVNTTYPLGTYCEDYAWSSSNGGDLDQYNGRFCVTPEFPSGTYAYFVTQDAAGVPQFPYYIGIYYYGDPDDANIVATVGGTATGITFPSSGTSCVSTGLNQQAFDKKFNLFPNPSNGQFTIQMENNIADYNVVEVRNITGQLIYTTKLTAVNTTLTLPAGTSGGIYFVSLLDNNNQVFGIKKMIIE